MKLLKTTAALLALSLAGCATTPSFHDMPFNPQLTANLPGDRTIVPGQRVGPIQIWETIDNAENTLGPPEVTTTWSSCYTGTSNCAYFNKYVWSRHGLMLYAFKDDPRQKIVEIDVYNHSTWVTNNGVSLSTPFYIAIDHINETTSQFYTTMCFDNGYCGAYDSDGMHIGTFGRGAQLDVMQIYDARFDATKQNRIPLGNYPPPNDMLPSGS